MSDFKVPKKLINILKENGEQYLNARDSKSLLVVHEGKLFVWHNTGSCVLSVDLNYEEIEGDGHKMLLPTNPPLFDVDCLLFNKIGSLLVIHGEKGLMVMQVPRFSASNSQQNKLFCRSWHIAERFFICSSEISLLQVSWHPGSTTCAHLVVLSTDHYLRVYDAMDAQTPVQVISLNQGKGYISSEFRVSFPECYGETPVSFDFGPSESAKVSCSSNKISDASENSDVIHPIYILYGNGDVYIARIELKRNGICSSAVEGPLSMYPPSEDNYGIDACSLLCLHCTPPILVMSMASGVLYHCILLEGTGESNQNIEPWLPSDCPDSDNDTALYVLGSVELPFNSPNTGAECGTSLRLYKDIACQSKYHCSVVSGAYTVVIPFVQKLEDCIARGDVENVSPLLTYNDSIVEHLLCTKPLPSVEVIPVIGLVSYIGRRGLNLICLLASWDIQCLPLLSSYFTKAPPLLSSDSTTATDSDSSSHSGESFEDHIHRMLQRSVCTPILKMNQIADSGDSSAKQFLDLIVCTTSRLQEEYVQRLYTVHSYIQSRVKVLSERKVQQLLELNRCLEEKEQLRDKAENLAEKYDDVNVNQQVLLGRIEKVLKTLQHQFPVLSSAEVEMKKRLTEIENKVKTYQTSLEQIQKKVKHHDKEVQEKESSSAIESLRNKLQSMNLGEVQLKHLKEILFQEGKQISSLVKSATSLKKEASS